MDLFWTWLICSACCFAGLVIGGFCRNSKMLETQNESYELGVSHGSKTRRRAMQAAYDRGFADGVSDERSRSRASIYDAFAEGHKRGVADAEDAIPRIVVES